MDTKKLRQKILDLAIRGKLVPQDPNDEPASVLLERIRAEKERLIKEGKIKRSKHSASDTPHYKNVPFEIPNSWCWCKIDDIAFVTKLAGFEYTNYIADNLNNTGGIPLFKGKNVQDGKIIYEFESYIPLNISNSLPRSQVNKKCLLTPYVGTIGNIGIHDKMGIYHLGSNVGKIELFNENRINIYEEFIRYYLMSSYGYKELTKHKKATAQDSISIDAIRDVNITLPPTNEQYKIIKQIRYWLSFVGDIEKNKDNISELVALFKARILDLAIHGKLVPQNSNEEPVIEFLKQINPKFKPCDNAHYENIPDSWEWCKLGLVGMWQSGATPSRLNKDYYGGNIPWLKTGDLNDDYIYEIPEYITQKALDETSVKLNPAGSVLIAMYGATIGKIGILTRPAATNQACCACVKFHGIEPKYLFYFLLSHKKEFIMLGGGGTQPNISKEKIVDTLIPLPPIVEQQRIVSAIEQYFTILDNISDYL